jgi:hypothetical protein
MAEQVEHWFNRRWGRGRRDVYLIRTETGWQVLGREGGADGREVSHYLDSEADARIILQRMRDTVPPELADWAAMTAKRPRRIRVRRRPRSGRPCRIRPPRGAAERR